MKNNDIKIIKDLSNAFGPSGYEDDIISIIKKEISNSYSLSIDGIKNLYISHKKFNNKRKILIDSHMDEVGFMIKCIDDLGLISFVNLGYINNINLLSQPVKIKTNKNKYVKGIIATLPTHYETDSNYVLNNLYIDIGAKNKEEVEELGITIGCVATFDSNFNFDEKTGIITGKALDCRLGCAAMIKTLNDYDDTPLKNYELIGLGSTQEELGLRGIEASLNKIKPDLAIIYEAVPCDDILRNCMVSQTKLNNGPMIRWIDSTAIMNDKFNKLAIDVAKENNICIQQAVREKGGTNAGILIRKGIPTLVIGIPSRYLHTSISICNLESYKSGLELAKHIIKKIDDIDFYKQIHKLI